MTERVLCVVAHPDDEVLGCGGTLAKHAQRGDAVSVIVFADGVGSRQGVSLAPLRLVSLSEDIKERHGMCRKACKILGTEDVWLHQFTDNAMDMLPMLQVVQQVEKHVDRFKPTVVYTHHSGDMNVDHRVVAEAVRTACRPLPGSAVRRLFFFEVPCSTGWGAGFVPNYFEDISATLETKMEAAGAYGAELRPWPHPRSAEGIRTLAQYRGASVGVPVAEAFMIGRIVA